MSIVLALAVSAVLACLLEAIFGLVRLLVVWALPLATAVVLGTLALHTHLAAPAQALALSLVAALGCRMFVNAFSGRAYATVWQATSLRHRDWSAQRIPAADPMKPPR